MIISLSIELVETVLSHYIEMGKTANVLYVKITYFCVYNWSHYTTALIRDTTVTYMTPLFNCAQWQSVKKSVNIALKYQSPRSIRELCVSHWLPHLISPICLSRVVISLYRFNRNRHGNHARRVVFGGQLWHIWNSTLWWKGKRYTPREWMPKLCTNATTKRFNI